MECVPGNPAVVHHIIVYLVPPGVTPSGQAGRLALELAGRFAPGLRPQSRSTEGYGSLRAEGLEAVVRDALHGQRHGADRSQLCGLRVGRSEDREEGSGRAKRRQLHVQDSAARSDNYQVEADFIFRKNSLLLTRLAAHARAWQGLPLRPGLSGRQDVKPCCGFRSTTSVGRRPMNWPSRSICRAAREAALRGPLRQLGRQLRQPRSDDRSRLGRANLGRDDVWLVRDGPGQSGPDASRPPPDRCGSRSFWPSADTIAAGRSD